MIVATATLIILLLVYFPIKIRVKIDVDTSRLSATIKVDTLKILFFSENVALQGAYLLCDGSVKTAVNLADIDKKHGVNLLKVFTLDRLCLSIRNNLSQVFVKTIIVENLLLATFLQALCNEFNVQLYAEVKATTQPTTIKSVIVASFSVAELSLCLLKQRVDLWKTRKSVK